MGPPMLTELLMKNVFQLLPIRVVHSMKATVRLTHCSSALLVN